MTTPKTPFVPTREQLALAAKAAGMAIVPLSEGIWHTEYGRFWHPTTNKSHSFDLMVACGIEPMFHDCAVSALSGSDFHTDPVYWLDQDKGLATMWAVFLCAVEIGRSL
jgi:hypothetical protein